MGTPHWQGFFRELEAAWLEIRGARPHWGKMYFQRERVADLYEHMDRFLEVRERWDPQRVFLNRFLENDIFQLERRPIPTQAEPVVRAVAASAVPAVS